VSPIVDIFPYREELDKEISRRALNEETDIVVNTPKGKKVFSAPSSDFDDDEEVNFDDEEESELEDEYSEEE
jgi:hypothetical protein